MEFVIGWSIFGVAVCVLFYVVSELRRRSKAKKAAREERLSAERYEKFCQTAKYNREHLPNTPIPPIHPIPEVVDSIMQKYTTFLLEPPPLDEYDEDSVSYVRLIFSDILWFRSNPTGVSLAKEMDVLKEYLREKYLLSEKSIDASVHIFYYLRRIPNL